MVDVNNTILKALTVALRKEFQEGLKHKPATWQEVAMRIPSTTAVNIYSWISSMPNMEEWTGQRVIKQLKEDGLYIANKLFTSTVGVPRTAFEDDQIGNYRLVSKQMGVTANKLPDQLVWPLLAKGLTTKCYDGQNFFDEEHPVYENVDGTGAVEHQSNVTTGTDDVATWYVIDDSNVFKPLIWQERTAPELEAKFSTQSDHVFMLDQYLYGARARGNAGFGFWQLIHAAVKTPLTAENLNKIMTQMKELRSDGDHDLDITPTKLIVPPKLETAAKTLLKTQIQNGTTNIYADCLKLHVESRLR